MEGLPTQRSASLRGVADVRSGVPEQSTVANLSAVNSAQYGVGRRKNSLESVRSERGLMSTLRQEETWSNDTVALVLWLPNYFAAPMPVRMDAQHFDCAQFLERESLCTRWAESGTRFVSSGGFRGGRTLSACCASGISDGRWKGKEMQQTHGRDVASGWTSGDTGNKGWRNPSSQGRCAGG